MGYAGAESASDAVRNPSASSDSRIRDRVGTFAGSSDSPSLSAPDTRHLERILRREPWFRIFMVVDLAVAAALLGISVGSGSLTPARVVIALLILLAARAHLSQLRSARLLRRLTQAGTARG